jgi:hypothetical protein
MTQPACRRHSQDRIDAALSPARPDRVSDTIFLALTPAGEWSGYDS